MKLKKVIATLAIGATIGAGVTIGAAHAVDYLHPASVDNPIAQSGCVIRFDEKTSTGNTRPSIHANSTHYCVGVQRVRASYPSGDLIIDLRTVGPIINIAVSPDETLTARGINCGPRGGMGTIAILCYDRYGHKIKAYSNKMYGTHSNLWVGWTSWVS